MTALRRTPRLDHLNDDMVRRVILTVSCHDTDAIPKAEGAGDVFELDGRLVQRMHNGVLVEEGCYHPPWMTEVIRGLDGHHEPQEELGFHTVLQRILATETEPTMIELGSWWAYYSLWFAAATGGGRVVAMEPDPVYLEVGRRNFALNGLEATFVHGGIGGEPGSRFSFVAESTQSRVEVPAYDLGSLMAETGLERVSLLLCDIQGAETLLLERARDDLLAGRVRFVVLSTHHHSISGTPLTHQVARDVLTSYGAHFIAEHSVPESFSGDGLIVVSFDERDRDLSVDVSRARHCQSFFGEPEHDLALAWQREQVLQARLADVEAELAALRATRLFRWTSLPRAGWSRLRTGGRR